MEKILSVIVPAYNVQDYLERCLISLLNEESILEDLEILIVNDGSKDQSLNVAKKYEKKYPNTVKVIDKENGGHGSTINVGLEKAKGKYFRVVDADDWVSVNDFPKYVKSLKELDTDIVITNYTREYIYINYSQTYKYEEALKYNKEYQFEDINLKDLNGAYFYLATTTFKTEVLRKANFKLDEKTFYVDMEFILFPIPYINNLIYLPYDVYRYYIGRPDQSINESSLIKNRMHHDKILRRVIEFYCKTELTPTKKKYISNIIGYLLDTHYSIFCDMKIGKEAKKEIRAFDKFLKEHSKEIYENTNKGYIKANRKNNFILCQMWKNFYTKMARKYSKDKE